MADFTPSSTGSMPFTSLVLEGEAHQRSLDPDRAVERPAMAQFILDQEDAVAQDFAAGRISEQEFNDFKALSQERADATRDGVRDALEPFVDDIRDWKESAGESLQNFMGEHGAEIGNLASMKDDQAVTRYDVSLGLVADTLGVTVDVADDLLERMPPHLHDIMGAVENGISDSAHDLLAARGELSSAGEHDLAADESRLENLSTAFEAEADSAHAGVDAGFDRIDADFDRAREVIDGLHDRANEDPEQTVEVMVERTIEDPQLQERMEDETGVSNA